MAKMLEKNFWVHFFWMLTPFKRYQNMSGYGIVNNFVDQHHLQVLAGRKDSYMV